MDENELRLGTYHNHDATDLLLAIEWRYASRVGHHGLEKAVMGIIYTKKIISGMHGNRAEIVVVNHN